MFYTKYGQIAFFLSYMFPPEAATNIVKHLKRFNGFELSRDFYIKKCNLSKHIPYQYILSTCLHCRLSSCPPSSIYSSVYKKDNLYRYHFQYRDYYHPEKITNKQFKQSFQKNHYKKNHKVAYRRNY